MILRTAMFCLLWSMCLLLLPPATAGEAEPSLLRQGIDKSLPKIVKIYGAGGLRGLEAYQSGFLISETGHVLTVWSYVLDVDSVTVVLDDGRRFEAEVLGADPRLEMAVLKFDGQDLPHFDLQEKVEPQVGDRVLAFSNLYGVATGDEPASVQCGVLSSLSTLSARHGVFATPYRGDVLVLDAMTNNPGSAGGAVTDERGRLLGMIGKELRDSQSNVWLNFALPVAELLPAVDDILAGRSRPAAEDDSPPPRHPLDLAALGVLLVPNVADSTPPYVEFVKPDSVAAGAGLLPDDLILFVNDRIVHSLRELRDVCRTIDASGSLQLTIRRGDELLVLTTEETSDSPQKEPNP